MARPVFPFLMIPDELITKSHWLVELSSGLREEEPKYLENWDNATDLTVSRELKLASRQVSDALQIPLDDCVLEILVLAGAGAAGHLPVEKWIPFRQVLQCKSKEGGTGLNVKFKIPGSRLADTLHLETIVALGKPLKNVSSPLSPRLGGSIVWRDRTRIRLEGDISRFPTSEVDLGQVLGDEWRNALWYLQVDWSDPEAGFDSVARLYVNSEQKTFVRRFRKGDADTLQAVMADIMGQITLQFLEYHDDPGDEHEDSSLAAVASHWLVLAFGSIEEARRVLGSGDWGRFHARLNALAAMRTPTE